MRWFRFYADALDDPKVQRLPGDLFKTWVNLLCLAAKNDGLLPPAEDMAFALRLSDAEMLAAFDEFVRRGLLDNGDDGVSPHNWEGRQPISDRDPTALSRKQNERARKRHAPVTDASRVTAENVTVPDKTREEEIREEKKETRVIARADEPPSPEIITSMSEVTDDQPYGMVAMLCEENGKQVATMPEPWQSQQRGIAKRLLLNHSIEQVRSYVRYRKTAWNGDTPFDLRHVDKDIDAWELSGSPPRASPNGKNGHRPVDRAGDTPRFGTRQVRVSTLYEEHDQ